MSDTHLTDRQREVLLAVIASRGSLSNASETLLCTPANVGIIVKHAGVEVPRGTTRAATRDRRVIAVKERLLRDGWLDPDRSRPPETVTVAAACHPDRQLFQMRLCRECYADRVARSRATRVGEEGRLTSESYSEVWVGDEELRDGDVLEADMTITDDRVTAMTARVVRRSDLALERVRDQLQRAQRAVSIALDAVDAAILDAAS